MSETPCIFGRNHCQYLKPTQKYYVILGIKYSRICQIETVVNLEFEKMTYIGTKIKIKTIEEFCGRGKVGWS
jgi:hypothetical protein